MKAYYVPYTHQHLVDRRINSLRGQGHAAYVDGSWVITDAAPYQMAGMSDGAIVRLPAAEYFAMEADKQA